jgi:hypothetical protein
MGNQGKHSKHGHKLSEYIKLKGKKNTTTWRNFSTDPGDPLWTARRLLNGYKKVLTATRPNTWGSSKNIYE